MLDSHGEVLKKSLLFNERNELAKLAGTYREPWWSWRQEPIRRGSADFLSLLAWRLWWPTLERPTQSRKANARVTNVMP